MTGIPRMARPCMISCLSRSSLLTKFYEKNTPLEARPCLVRIHGLWHGRTLLFFKLRTLLGRSIYMPRPCKLPKKKKKEIGHDMWHDRVVSRAHYRNIKTKGRWFVSFPHSIFLFHTLSHILYPTTHLF